jgi:flavin reductase (DIM6/NTAB) family NADH-FMN oxidoreductase RutF
MYHERKLPEPQLLRQTFSLFPSGVACIGAVVDGTKEALVASSFTVGVSLDPPLVSFAVQNTSTTWPIVRRSAMIGVSVMASDHSEVARRIASKDRAHRFDDVDTHVAASGALFVEGGPVWLECTIYSEIPAGDHHMVLLQVQGLGLDPELPPLVFHKSRFSRVHVED